ncbi:MAG: TldD/PmbA family protein [Chloroflexi bacterium]|nr:TldD/PmbA family protein [Chloroflexota bacterium]
MVEEILAKAKKVAQEAEVFLVSSEETSVQFEANRLKHVQSRQSQAVSLRVIKNGRIGYASSTTTENSQELVNMAVETAQFGQKAEFEFPSPTAYKGVRIFDASVAKVSPETMTGLGEKMISTVRKGTPGLLCEGGVGRSTTTVSIMNSRGGQASYKESHFSLGIEGQLVRDTDMLFVGDSQSSCRPILETSEVTGIILKQLEYARTQAPVATKPMPVIFTTQGVASALVSPLMAAFNGKTVLEGASPIGSKLGQLVFDKRFSLRDDPLVSYRPSSRPCDDEGVPSQRTPLVTRGVISNFLYDLQTAGLAKTKSTGNGSRGRGALPAPSPSAFIITPGKTTFDEMVSDIKEGLVVEQLMGATQGNVLGGDFSGNLLLGYKIENGKIVGRVKDTMVSGNIYKLLKDIAAIGSESRWEGSFLNTPPIYLTNVSVAS